MVVQPAGARLINSSSMQLVGGSGMGMAAAAIDLMIMHAFSFNLSGSCDL